ncbi:MAG TPA: HEAT repeat domain-containing protein [Gammaproteobacteria bacterium]|nr:HEAT repeat domain-containing protein [Gammaproteobacteria bacterium]
MDRPGNNTPPDALMFLGTRCPHCPSVLNALATMLKAGVIGTLRAVNIEQHPEIAQETGVRGVPWVRIGTIELEGLRSEKELREWAAKAGTTAGLGAWLDELLSTGGIDRALALIRSDTDALDALLMLFADPETQLNTRIGISAIMEDLAGSGQLQGLTQRLGRLTRHREARIRGDACHYLGLAGDPAAVEYLRPCLQDPDAEVREVAEEALQALQD